MKSVNNHSHRHNGHDHTAMHKSHTGHSHENHDHHGMIEDFARRFWISLVLSIPIIVISPMIQHLLGYSLVFRGQMLLSFILSSIVYFYGGWPFLTGLIDEIRRRKPGMMTLIALAVTVAYVYSTATVFWLEGMDFFWELATLIVIMLAGHWIEMKSVMGASRALELLVSMIPSQAHIVRNGSVEDIPVAQLRIGDIARIRPGDKIPADGNVADGESYVDESMITGESKPVKKQSGMDVIGGSVNGNGSFDMRIEHTGAESYLNKVITLVREAQKTKSGTQRLADRAAQWLTYLALGAGLVTLLVWLLLGADVDFAIERMVTVMVISCPHALGLAIPLVVAISTALSAKNGLLIRNRTAFENARRISSIVFDKTGTLTLGNFAVTRFVSVLADLSDHELLAAAASLEQNSEHPIAMGILTKARELQLSLKSVGNFNAINGKGIEGLVDGISLRVVSPGYLRENGVPVPKQAFTDQAETVVFVLLNDRLAGYIGVADQIRPESPDAVRHLKSNGMKVYMATGDNQAVAEAVSTKLGLDGYFAEVLPHQKVDIVKDLQQKGDFVAMTGDGINDAPALARADIGIAVGSGTDVAAESADIILVNSNPKDIESLISFGRSTYKKMVQNLVWATGYNLIAIPFAAGLFSSWGIILDPAVGAILMSVSTVVVAINAQLLRLNR